MSQLKNQAPNTCNLALMRENQINSKRAKIKISQEKSSTAGVLKNYEGGSDIVKETEKDCIIKLSIPTCENYALTSTMVYQHIVGTSNNGVWMKEVIFN